MYKIGVIGLGQIAYSIDKDPNRKIIWSHIKAYQNIEKCQILAICDINLSTVENVQKECNIKNGYTDYNKMLDENEFDIVSICTPIQTHYEIVKKCIKSGVKAIFCEKTLSYSLDEAEEMLKLSKENNIIFGVNYILRWDIFNKRIKELLEKNTIGKIYTMVGYGATALYTSTSHLIDLMVYFANSEVDWVIGRTQKDFVRNVHGIEDCGGIGTIKFKSGIFGFIKGTSTSPFKYMLELDILGENGRIKLYNNGLSYDVYQYSKNSHTAGANYEDLILVETHNKNNENERMIDAILDIIKCIEVGGQPLSNICTAIESIKIIEGIKKSDKEDLIKF
ncbi:Gfo/Idh/MocA family protein (plasmid) [Fusobacterium necrophorum subsp. funduliforme]